MEHLLPPGQKPPFRVLFFSNEPDTDGVISSVEDYTELFQGIIDNPKGETAQDRYQPWFKRCGNGRVLGLCHALLIKYFFGPLAFVLGDDEIHEDFMEVDDRGHVYVTTAALEPHLLDWQSKVQLLDESDQADLQASITRVLEHAATVLRHLSAFLDYTYREMFPAMGEPFMRDDPLGKTHFACVLLHQALNHACGKVLGIPVRAGNSLSLRAKMPWLKGRMEMEGWCPFTIWRLYMVNDIEELVYGYGLGTSRVNQDHKRCSAEVCMANSIAVGAAPRHVIGGGCENCPMIFSPLVEMLDIIRAGQVPVLRIETDDGDKLCLRARPMNESTKYIALSHVYADGLGCSNSNAITQCQLVRLAHRLGNLELSENCGDLFIWIDTLCIPTDPSLQSLRDAQIQKMREIYRGAYAVLVMDADTLCMKQDAPVEEVSMRLYMSAWTSRLWCYQEGSLNSRVLIMTTDGLVDLDVLCGIALNKNVTLDPISHGLVDKMLRSTIYEIGRPHYNHSPSDTDEDSQKAFYAVLDRSRREGDHDAQKMLHAIRDRLTSRADDEAIIIGSSMGLAIAPILQAPPEQRMMALIKAMPHVPANLMFSLGRRLDEPGFRWAPATVLRARGGCVMNPTPDLVPMTRQDTQSGNRTVRRMCSLDPRGRGLQTFNPAIRLPREYFRSGSNLVYVFLGVAAAIHGLVADLESAERTQEIATMLDEGRNLIVLVHEFDPQARLYIGVLVETCSQGSHWREYELTSDGVTKAKFCMVVSFSANVSYPIPEALLAGNTIVEVSHDDAEALDGENSRHDQARTEDAALTKLAAVVEPGSPGEEKRKKYHAEWLTPRFWLVD